MSAKYHGYFEFLSVSIKVHIFLEISVLKLSAPYNVNRISALYNANRVSALYNATPVELVLHN